MFYKQQRLQEWSLRNPSPTPTLANVGVASTTRAQDLLPYLLAERSQRRHRFRESRLREELPCEKAAAQINPNTKNPSCCSELPRAIRPPQPSTGADILISLKSSRITQRGSNFLLFFSHCCSIRASLQEPFVHRATSAGR